MGICESCNKSRPFNSGFQEPREVQVLVYNELLSNSIFSTLPNSREIVSELFKHIQEKQPHKNKIQFKNIFRASDHNYKASAFRQHCHNKFNTLVIAITTQNRIFGGFTPCTWLKNLHYQYEEDIYASSFLFRIKNDKIQFYNIKNQQKQKAIVNHAETGPTFGEGHDLYISDECDKYDSWNSIGKTYESRYDYGSKKANMQLSGQLRHKIRDYQVWQLVP